MAEDSSNQSRQLPPFGSEEYDKQFKETIDKLLGLVNEMKQAPEVYSWAKSMLDEIPQFIECKELTLEGANILLIFLNKEFETFKAQGPDKYKQYQNV